MTAREITDALIADKAPEAARERAIDNTGRDGCRAAEARRENGGGLRVSVLHQVSLRP
jgi:hypothetical protein